MANAMYTKGLNSFLQGEINWVSDSVSAILINTSLYTVDIANHQYLSSIPAGARVATAPLTGKTASGGVADAADLVFSAVSGAACSAIAMVKITGNEATSNLLLYFDTATGLPVTPNGGDLTLTFDNGANKIFKL
jgi:hypothetical protein